MKKKPFVTKEQLEEIVKKYPTPFHLYDEKGIRENAKAVKEAFAWNPGFREYFAVKATPNPFILDILKEYDCGCDCASLTELMLADSQGFDGKHIMFSSNDTPAEEFAFANELGAIINLDDFTHIDFLEKTIGRAILPVCAAGLIFLSLVFFAMLVLPYLSQGVKMVLMYTVSAAITLAGGILVAHDRRNKAFLGLLGCGMGAWYLSLFLSDFYFHAINDGILYLGLLVWAVVLCVLSRLRSNLFLIIGQIGVGISLILGVLMCNWTENAERFLILSIYYAVTQTIFFVSHLRREYYRNAVNLVSWSIGLLILVLGAAASYTEGSAAGNVSVVLLLALAAVPVLLGVAAAEMDENGKLLGGIVGALCIIIFCGLFLNRFTGAALLLLVFGIAVLALLEFRRPGDLSAGSAGGGCFCADVLCGSCRAVFRGVYIDGTSGGGVPSVRFPAQKKSIPGGGTRLWHPAVADPDERGHENGLGTGIFLQRGAADPVLQGTV